MLEDSSKLIEMNKVPALPSQNGVDSKKDTTKSRKQGYNKGKEFSAASRQEPVPRRQSHQKSRYGDRRPRNREFSDFGQKQKVENQPTLNQGSKKGNYNHLLNFSYDVPERYGGKSNDGRKLNKNHGRSRNVRFNKEQFIQANCQFIVRDSGEYTVHCSNPDILVDWEKVEQIRLFSQGVPSCPICLYPPVAAKITRCGHIYCWSCMLHYLSLSEKTWGKCPICFENVNEKDLKSVKTLNSQSIKVGDKITLNLMKRDKCSTVCMPVEEWQPTEVPLKLDDVDDYSSFAKVLLASSRQTLHILDGEKTELLVQLAELAEESLEKSFVRGALEALKNREDELMLRLEFERKNSMKEENLKTDVGDKKEKEVLLCQDESSNKEEVVTYLSAFDDENYAACGISKNLDAEALTQKYGLDGSIQKESLGNYCGGLEQSNLISEESDQSSFEPQDGKVRRQQDYFYFYQAEDGQHIYLHSVNARCLVKEYGGLDKAPSKIVGTIAETEYITMSEDLRKRLRYLNHLPLRCEFQIVELILRPPLISEETLCLFAEEINHRRHMRQKKSRDEKRKLRQMQQKENLKIQQCPEVWGCYGEHVAKDESVFLPSEAPLLLGSSPSEESSLNKPPLQPSSTTDNSAQQPNLSFAQMLRAGKTQAQNPANLKNANQMSVKNDSNSDEEDGVLIPTYQQSFGEALESALNNIDKDGEDIGSNQSKKKKKVKKLLFTNTMARSK